MPVYEFRCATCDATFEVLRPVAAASEPALCPDGHTDTARLLSLIAPTRAGAPAGGGGCCAGGACACAN